MKTNSEPNFAQPYWKGYEVFSWIAYRNPDKLGALDELRLLKFSKVRWRREVLYLLRRKNADPSHPDYWDAELIESPWARTVDANYERGSLERAAQWRNHCISQRQRASGAILVGQNSDARRRIRDLVTQPACQGLSENEIGCARISRMARSTNAPFTGRIQKRKTNHLHPSHSARNTRVRAMSASPESGHSTTVCSATPEASPRSRRCAALRRA